MASNQEVTVPCRYWVDNERKRVVMAEASGHFVDVLFSFLTLPLGTIIRLGNTLGQPIEIGCINNLFKSVEALNPDVFWNDICKRMLLWYFSVYFSSTLFLEMHALRTEVSAGTVKPSSTMSHKSWDEKYVSILTRQKS